jgi:hypothetical protein
VIVKAFGTITIDTELLDQQIAWICDRLAESPSEEGEGIYNTLAYLKDKVEEADNE